MNKITILAISAVFVASILAITAFEAEAKPPSQSVACPAENIQHWNKIVFVSQVNLQHDTLPNVLAGRTYEVVLQVNPNGVDEVKSLVIQNLDGYLRDGNPITPDNLAILFTEISYSTICAEN